MFRPLNSPAPGRRRRSPTRLGSSACHSHSKPRHRPIVSTCSLARSLARMCRFRALITRIPFRPSRPVRPFVAHLDLSMQLPFLLMLPSRAVPSAAAAAATAWFVSLSIDTAKRGDCGINRLTSKKAPTVALPCNKRLVLRPSFPPPIQSHLTDEFSSAAQTRVSVCSCG